MTPTTHIARDPGFLDGNSLRKVVEDPISFISVGWYRVCKQLWDSFFIREIMKDNYFSLALERDIYYL
jgi:hypothetical protein